MEISWGLHDRVIEWAQKAFFPIETYTALPLPSFTQYIVFSEQIVTRWCMITLYLRHKPYKKPNLIQLPNSDRPI